ncbi:hypothetical protein MYCTH_94523 [Thermothelomyces thermophilus ATCC 42464]|uniref:Uncharacterized protein n=1 Tax=Thermothelomyces thermophilus (strain ATCC 42464 / BCRC 31852 / DSM 1799) TaxID=573729 RepID=G2QGX1_THET4|nr:uncharacterized protein MYCTH_94523 [Thermothelomyces thermophilus ATCC 42464]AEO59478.1 hypothetical protein MYCTH_94523 [Thermothelomyces thermophilus ATCC 42464]
MFGLRRGIAALQRQTGGGFSSSNNALIKNPASRPKSTQRNWSSFPGKNKNKDDMGGPGGQEHFPESTALRRKFRMTTMYGVLAACVILAGTRMVRRYANPTAGYVLVHDSSKGELDDVKYIKESELPRK